MATTSLLEAISFTRESKSYSSSSSTLKWNPLLKTQISIRSINRTPLTFVNLSKCCRPSKFSVKCCKNSKRWVKGIEDEEERRKGKNSFEGFAEMVLKAFKALQKPVIAAVVLGLLLTCDPHSALAASGGRMGGQSFSSRSSSSSSSSRSSYSAPSRDYSFGSASPRIVYSAPYYAPSPFGVFGGGEGFLVGPVVGVGVGLAAFVLVSGFLSDRSEGSLLNATEKTSVLKLQVGLLGKARKLQRDLDRIAETADTSTSQGLSYVLTETTLALLRNTDCCISGYSSVDVKRSVEEGEKRFNKLSIEERGKFDEETLVNVNNIKRQSTTSMRTNRFGNEYIVITILVAAEGVHKLPAINGSADLKEALEKLGSIPSKRTLAVEVLWTPQNENDTLTERELLEDYSILRPL